MTCRQLKPHFNPVVGSMDALWWEPEDPWDKSRFTQRSIHLLDGRGDAARFVDLSTSEQIVVDVTPWLSHPLAAQLATWISPVTGSQSSTDFPSPLGLLRRMSIALSGPAAIPGHFDRLKWQGAATLAHFSGPLENDAAIHIQTAGTAPVFATNERLTVWTISTAQQVITLEVATGLPPRAWCEAVGPTGSLVVDGFLDPSRAAKPRFWVHDALGLPRAEEFSAANEVELFVGQLHEARDNSALRQYWKERILKTSQWLENLEKAARESTVGGFRR